METRLKEDEVKQKQIQSKTNKQTANVFVISVMANGNGGKMV